VREALAAADLVVPDLDAGSAGVFRRVNRPHRSLLFRKVVGGIEKFTRTFKGRVWLEVVLVRGINDNEAELRRIAALAARIRPDRVQLNTVVRPPAAANARPLSTREMQRAAAMMREALAPIPVEVVGVFRGGRRRRPLGGGRRAILAYLARRPGTIEDLSAALGLHRNEVVKIVARLLDDGAIRRARPGEGRYLVGEGSRRRA